MLQKHIILLALELNCIEISFSCEWIFFLKESNSIKIEFSK